MTNKCKEEHEVNWDGEELTTTSPPAWFFLWLATPHLSHLLLSYSLSYFSLSFSYFLNLFFGWCGAFDTV